MPTIPLEEPPHFPGLVNPNNTPPRDTCWLEGNIGCSNERDKKKKNLNREKAKC